MPKSEMSRDTLDQDLIGLLRSDARLPVAKLAATLGVSRATVRARMGRLEAQGVIAGYTLVLQGQVRAGAIRAVTMIAVDGKHSEQVIRRLAGLPEITALYTTNGRWDVVAEIETDTLGNFDDLLRVIRQVDGIANTETSLLLAARKSTRVG